MGIDIYLRWNEQTKAEQDEQITGFSAVHGNVGYLREAYHGAPYATKHLVPEAFTHGEAQIPAEALRRRLPETLKLVAEREKKLYNSPPRDIAEVQESFAAFVALAERKERETGAPCTVIASY